MYPEKETQVVAKKIRQDILLMALNSGTKGAHIGGSMSAADILAVLYSDIMKFDKDDPEWDGRDRFIMSKAHSAIGLYAALHQVGFLSDEDINKAMQPDELLFKHPKMDIEHGIEFSGGSLGMGLGLAAGGALALKKKGNLKSKYYVMIGDGECDEGSIWEAASFIVTQKLNNIVVIVDANGLQNDGQIEKVLNLGNLTDRWQSVGFCVREVDGHNCENIKSELLRAHEQPLAVIAHTIKGKGVAFAENKTEWHIGYLTRELFDQAMREI